MTIKHVILAPNGSPRPEEETFDFLDFMEITINKTNGRHLAPQNTPGNFWNPKRGLVATPTVVKSALKRKYPASITEFTIGAKEITEYAIRAKEEKAKDASKTS